MNRIKLLSVMLLMCFFGMHAQTFESGNFSCRLRSGKVEIHGLTSAAASQGLTTITIPGFVTYNGTVYPTKIYAMAFSSNTTIKTITVEYGCTEIEQQAFNGMTALQRVNLPSSVETLGSYIFQNAGNSSEPLVLTMAHQRLPSSISSYALSSIKAKQLTCVLSTYRAVNAFKKSSVFTSAVATWIQMPDLAHDYVRAGYNGYYVVTQAATATANGHLMLVGRNPGNDAGTVRVPASGTLGDGLTYVIDQVADSCFLNDAYITSFTMSSAPYMSKIGKHAFKNCVQLKTVNTNARTIDIEAFQDCSALSSLTLGEGVAYIYDRAFQNTGVVTVTLPASFAIWYTSVFSSCRYLASYYIASGNNNFSVANGLLYNKSQTELVSCPSGIVTIPTLPSTLRTIHDRAFETLNNCTKVEIPYGVTKLGYHVFENSTSLQNVKIPSSVTTVGTYLFHGCSGLKNVALNIQPAGNPYLLNKEAWTDVPRKTCTIWVPAGTSYWENNWVQEMRDGDYDRDVMREFSNVKVGAYDFVSQGYPFTFNEGGVNVTLVRGDIGYETPTAQLKGGLSIPGTVIYNNMAYNVIAIDRQAFANNTQITTVRIDPNIRQFKGSMRGYGSFSVSYENETDVYRYGGNQFAGCTSLTSIQLPPRLDQIPMRCFYNTPISEINIPYGVEQVGWQAFAGTNITTLVMPHTVTYFHRAFDGMTKLANLYINSPYNNNLLFNNESSTLPSTKFALYVPVGCLKEYQNNNAWKSKAGSIQSGAYDFATTGYKLDVVDYTSSSQTAKIVYNQSNRNLTEVAIGGNVVDPWGEQFKIVEIGDSCFASAINLKKAIFAPDYPGKVIPRHAFNFCIAMTENNFTSLPLTEIGEYAFNSCRSLKNLVLPETLESIGDFAFYGCQGIETIYTHNEKWGINVFGLDPTNQNRTAKVYVPLTLLEDRLNEIESWTYLKEYSKLRIHPYLRNTGGPQLICCTRPMSDQAKCDFRKVTGYNANNNTFTTAFVDDNRFLAANTGLIADNLLSDYVPLTIAKTDDEINAAQTLTNNYLVGVPYSMTVTKSNNDYNYKLNPDTKQMESFTTATLGDCEAYVRIAGTGGASPVTLDYLYDGPVDPVYPKGDVDGSGLVDVDDVNAVINIILGSKSVSDYKGIADVDGSGLVDVDDVNVIINIILGS